MSLLLRTRVVEGVLAGLESSPRMGNMPEILQPLYGPPKRDARYSPFTAQEASTDPSWNIVSRFVRRALVALSAESGFSGSPAEVLAVTYQALLEANVVSEGDCTRIVGVATFAFREILVTEAQGQLEQVSEEDDSTQDLRRLVALDHAIDQTRLTQPQVALVTLGVFGGIPAMAMAEMISLATRVTFRTFEDAKRHLRSELETRVG